MLIPVRCFSCGKILSDKWNDYVKLTEDFRTTKQQHVEMIDVDVLNKVHDETPEAKAMKKLNIHRMCCRRHFLCNVDLTEII